MLSSDDLVDFHFVEEDRIIVLEPEAELPPPDDPPPATQQVEKGMQADDAVAGPAFEELAMLREELEAERRRSKSLVDENTLLEFEVERLRKDALVNENVRAQSLKVLERKVELLRENARLENMQLVQKKALKDLCAGLRRMTGIVIGMAVVLGLFTLVSAIMSASLLERSRGKERHSDEQCLLSKLDLPGEGGEVVPIITSDDLDEEDIEFEHHSFSYARLDACEEELELLRERAEDESRRFMRGLPVQEETVMARLHSLIPDLLRNNISVALFSGSQGGAIQVWAQQARDSRDQETAEDGQAFDPEEAFDRELQDAFEAGIASSGHHGHPSLFQGPRDDVEVVLNADGTVVKETARGEVACKCHDDGCAHDQARLWYCLRLGREAQLAQAREEERAFWASVFNIHGMTSAPLLQTGEAGSEKRLLRRLERSIIEQSTREEVVEEQKEEEAPAAAMEESQEVPTLVSEACQQPEACQVAKYSVLHIRQLQTQRLRTSVRFSSENHWSLSNAIRLWLQAAPQNTEDTHQWRVATAKTQLPPRFLGVTLDTPAPASLESDRSSVLAAYDTARKFL